MFVQSIGACQAATCKDIALVTKPLRMAIWQCSREGHRIKPGQPIGPVDASSQYTSITFTEHLDLDLEGIRPSIGTMADAYDDALLATAIGLFKTECLRTTCVPPRPLAKPRRRRVGHGRLGRLLKQPPPPQ